MNHELSYARLNQLLSTREQTGGFESFQVNGSIEGVDKGSGYPLHTIQKILLCKPTLASFGRLVFRKAYIWIELMSLLGQISIIHRSQNFKCSTNTTLIKLERQVTCCTKRIPTRFEHMLYVNRRDKDRRYQDICSNHVIKRIFFSRIWINTIG